MLMSVRGSASTTTLHLGLSFLQILNRAINFKNSKLKQTVPILNRSNVINKINCSSCNGFYVGLTTRRLHKRLEEHKKRAFCSVHRHNSQKDHIIDFDKILASDHKKQRPQIKKICIY